MILVTGGKGFIGSYLDFDQPTLKLDRVYDVVSGFSVPECDLIIHLAALNSSAESIDDPFLYLQTNVVGTVRMLELARLHRARFIYLNTVKEAELNPYGVSKLCATKWVEAYQETYNLEVIINKVGNIYGEGGDQFFVNQFARRAVTGEPVTIYGTGNDKRTILHVKDLVRFIKEQVNDFDKYKGVNHVSGGKDNEVSVNELIRHLKIKNVVRKNALPGQQMYFSTDTILKPEIGWREGVTKLKEHYAECN
jgi:nucleoside-diphosphate-sugar epimerase